MSDPAATPGSQTLPQLIGGMTSRIDEIVGGQAVTHGKLTEIEGRTARIEAGMNGMVPRLYAVEKYQAAEVAAVGDIPTRAQAMRAFEALRSEHTAADEQKAEVRTRARGIAWDIARAIALIVAGVVLAWISHLLNFKIPDMP